MQLTEHFADTELGVANCDPRIMVNAQTLCEKILEPIRAQLGPIAVDDGYRDPAHNARVGGKPDSQHLYLNGNSAADIRSTQAGLQEAFDWIRLTSHLPFDQVILEYAHGAPACIHLSYDSGKTEQRRQALTGTTGAGTVYVEVEVR
jgi:hypothetical protein